MKRNDKLILVTAGAGMLSLVGLLFSGLAPEGLLPGVRSSGVFTRMLAFHAMALLAGCSAWCLGWTRWLRAAPWLAIGWVVLFVRTAIGSPAGGRIGWFCIGPFSVDVRCILPLVVALLLAWTMTLRLRVTWKRTVCLLILVFVALTSLLVNRDCSVRKKDSSAIASERSESFSLQSGTSDALAREWKLSRYHWAMAEAGWFSSTPYARTDLPGSLTTAAVAGAALTLGKWSAVAVGFALSLLSVVFCTLIWTRNGLDPEEKPFRAFALGLLCLLVLPSVMNYLNIWGIVPFSFGLPIPLLSYSGCLALSTCLSIGILCSFQRKEKTGDCLASGR